ncbi:ABC transporter permease [Microbacterium sp.]|uniref:ABC transporter permease n=1 Tax=Microbacterium sp. TaxID=51671 RepID=UPI003F7269FB
MTTTTRPARPRAFAPIEQCGTFAWRGVEKIRRNPAGLTDVVLGPAIFLVLFGYVFGGAIAGSTSEYLQYVFPGILGLTTLLATMGVGVAISTDLKEGVFDRFRSLPIARIAPLAGAVLADIVRQIVSLTALIGFGLLLGVRFDTDPASFLAGCALAIGFALALSWVWVLLGVAINEPQAVQGIGALLIFPLSFISNIFVPVDTMPGWMQTIAEWNPVGHLVETIRGLWMGGPVTEPLLATLAWMGVFLVVFVPLSLIAYLRRACG